MSEFRQNFITKEWVIIAPERKKRPHDFKKEEAQTKIPEYDKNCPFCPGNYSEKYEETLFEIKEGNRWLLRVVKNRYSALHPDTEPMRQREKSHLKVMGYGFAEVIIESPYHNKNFSNYTLSEIKNILLAYKNRYDTLSHYHPKIDLILIFKNYGRYAGTSLIHPHSQIIATPIVPLSLRTALLEARVFCDEQGICPFCQMIKEEKEQNVRVPYENENFIAICPFASRTPYEVWILPKRHNAKFDFNDEELTDFADILSKILKALHKIFPDLSYNYIIKSAPIEDHNVEYFHWYLEILPRLTMPAGFEMGSGIYINPTPPEEASKEIKERIINYD